MSEERAVIDEQAETDQEKATADKVSCHIYIFTEAYEQIKKWAEYAAIEGLIEGHPRGNFSGYCNFCFNLGEDYLRRYMLKKRGYK